MKDPISNVIFIGTFKVQDKRFTYHNLEIGTEVTTFIKYQIYSKFKPIKTSFQDTYFMGLNCF